MTDFSHGQRVEYTGTLVPRLIGQRGSFIEIGRNGWAVVDFDRDGELKVAPANLSPVAATAA